MVAITTQQYSVTNGKVAQTTATMLARKPEICLVKHLGQHKLAVR